MTASVSDVTPLEQPESNMTERLDSLSFPGAQGTNATEAETDQDENRTDSEPEPSRVPLTLLMKRNPQKRTRLDSTDFYTEAVSSTVTALPLGSSSSLDEAQLNIHRTYWDTDETDSEPELRQRRLSPKPVSPFHGSSSREQGPMRKLQEGSQASVFSATSIPDMVAFAATLIPIGLEVVYENAGHGNYGQAHAQVDDTERTDSEPDPEERLQPRREGDWRVNFEEIEFLDNDQTDSDPDLNLKDGEKTDSDSDLEVYRQQRQQTILVTDRVQDAVGSYDFSTPTLGHTRNTPATFIGTTGEMPRSDDDDTDSDLDLRSRAPPARRGGRMIYNDGIVDTRSSRVDGPTFSTIFSEVVPPSAPALLQNSARTVSSMGQSVEDDFDESTETDSELELT
ncbi:hypothetical protein BGZ83_001557 [Gryganskiella cystojenkinii]|nr:hypothetical protein BGZ83_001557 [Gryganskiella cystojenkinii]